MRKTVLTVLSVLFAFHLAFSTPASAAPVDAATARLVAAHFWDTYRPADAKPAGAVASLAFAELPHLHIIAVGDNGFVIVAGDDCVRPVLAYAFDAPFPVSLNAELRYWLGTYEEQIAAAAEEGRQPSGAVAGQWDALLHDPVPPTPLTIADIPAMMTTRWDQGAPYNLQCPYDSTGDYRTVVGCTATAMAQIMKYWNYPAYGQGSRSYYQRNLGTISADFGNATYHWEQMANRLDQYSQATEISSVALLSYHCGVAVEMDYGASSGSYVLAWDDNTPCAHNALVQHFKYSDAITSVYRDGVSDSTWIARIDTEMAHRRPILYSGFDSDGGGHAFVLDGADLQGRYHFNWGWSGYGDGFYTVDSLNPGGGGAGGSSHYTYNIGQGALFGIQPAMTETFDTVDYYDSICNDSRTHQFYDYTFQVGNLDTLVRHLGTVYRYHLKVINRKRCHLNPNGTRDESEVDYYCPATGFLMPQCHWSKENCLFTGWCRRADGSDSIYQPGETGWFNGNVTLYAQWRDTTQHQGIGELPFSPLQAPISLFPNPTTGEVTIALETDQEAQIQLFDAVGRLVLRQMAGHVAKISLTALPRGVYTLQVKTTDGTYNQRVIKQ